MSRMRCIFIVRSLQYNIENGQGMPFFPLLIKSITYHDILLPIVRKANLNYAGSSYWGLLSLRKSWCNPFDPFCKIKLFNISKPIEGWQPVTEVRVALQIVPCNTRHNATKLKIDTIIGASFLSLFSVALAIFLTLWKYRPDLNLKSWRELLIIVEVSLQS